MNELMLKNAIRLLIGGYLYDTDISDDVDELEKLISVPALLQELADDYKNELKVLSE